MQVEIWSDVVCPWCYIGKRNLETALAGFAHRDEVEVIWRSYELQPTAPAEREGDYVTRLARKYGVGPSDARAMLDRMTSAAAGAGLDFDFDRLRPGNTFDAHRLIHLAKARGMQDAVKERLLRATFCEGEPIGLRDTLVQLGVDAGLDEPEVRAVLEGEAYAADVRADEHDAAAMDITAVPFFVIDRKFGIPGAQAPETMAAALQRAWDKFHAPALVTTTDDTAPGCEGDACAV
jgi:predicted DsbA family dithiol-disulfide isomerase